jgi:hypothetical protein
MSAADFMVVVSRSEGGTMYLSDPMARYRRSLRAEGGCADRGCHSPHQIARVSPAERARLLRMLRFDHSIIGHC